MPILQGFRSEIIDHRKKSTNYELRTQNFKVKRGFTLIELLTVITIIGILAGIIIASYSNAQAKGRDTRRKTDLDALKKALELAKQDTTGFYYYPGCNPTATSCLPSLTSPALAPTYIKSVPTDPRSSNYSYIPTPASCTGPPTPTCTSYTLISCLENTKDTQRDEAQTGGINNSTVCTNASTKSYTVTPN